MCIRVRATPSDSTYPHASGHYPITFDRQAENRYHLKLRTAARISVAPVQFSVSWVSPAVHQETFASRHQTDERMKTCIDVYYDEDRAIAGAIVFENWTDAEATSSVIHVTENCEEYRPGHFYKRELPALLAVLERLPDTVNTVNTVIIDGYVWLDDLESPGLGAHLYDALQKAKTVIGVAKNKYRNSAAAVEIERGDSTRPLFVTAAGMSAKKSSWSHLPDARGLQNPHSAERRRSNWKRPRQSGTDGRILMSDSLSETTPGRKIHRLRRYRCPSSAPINRSRVPF